MHNVPNTHDYRYTQIVYLYHQLEASNFIRMVVYICIELSCRKNFIVLYPCIKRKWICHMFANNVGEILLVCIYLLVQCTLPFKCLISNHEILQQGWLWLEKYFCISTKAAYASKFSYCCFNSTFWYIYIYGGHIFSDTIWLIVRRILKFSNAKNIAVYFVYINADSAIIRRQNFIAGAVWYVCIYRLQTEGWYYIKSE